MFLNPDFTENEKKNRFFFPSYLNQRHQNLNEHFIADLFIIAGNYFF